jgi:sulfonate transport system permease protein
MIWSTPMSTSVLPARPRTTSRPRDLEPTNSTGAAADVAAAPTAPPTPRSRRPPVPRWASLAAVVALWQLASATGILPADKLAAPSTIAITAWRLIGSGELGSALLVSSGRIAFGLLFGLTAGVVLGLVSGLSRWADALLDPPVQALRTLPHLGLIPLFILWFGIDETPKILLIALGVAFPVYLAIHSGVREADPKLLEAARVLGFTRRQRIWHVSLPAALPQGLVGLRQGLGMAWLSLIVGEQVNASAGLGYLINNARDFLQTDVIVVGLVVYAVLGLLTDALVRAIERRALTWRGVQR